MDHCLLLVDPYESARASQYFEILTVPSDQPDHEPKANISVTLKVTHSPQEITKIIHDFRGSVTALKINLAMQEESIAAPTERDQKKFAQLKRHLTRLADAADHISAILNAATK